MRSRLHWLSGLLALPLGALAQSPSARIFPPSERPRTPATQGIAHQVPVADYMAPAPGRVRIDFESEGRAQSVVVERRLRVEAVDSRGNYHSILGSGTCVTPCVMFIPPGPVQLRTHGSGLRDGSFDMEIPRESSRVRLRAASRQSYDLGTGLVAAGATVFLAEALVAAVAQGVGSSALPESAGVPSSNGPVLTPTVAITLAAVAVALLATGIPLLLSHQTGIRRVTRSARWVPAAGPDGAVWVF